MPRLLKSEIQRRSDEIKELILSGLSFQKPLAQFYTELRLQAQHKQIIVLYRFLLLYTDKKQTAYLYHPALLQALISQGNTREAFEIGQKLLHTNPNDPETVKFIKSLTVRTQSQIPAYTPFTQLSSYSSALQSDPAAKKKGDLIKNWAKSAQKITPQKLTELGYYKKKKQLAGVPLPYRRALQENFDEFLICYMLGLERSVVGLTGTLLEMLLAVHLHRAQKQKKYLINGQHKKTFELSLNELLQLYHQQKLLPESVLRLFRAARMQRNFIHPGKEVLENDRLTQGGVQICFLAVMESIDALL